MATHDAYKGSIIGGSRVWNNSMYHYEDRLQIWDDAKGEPIEVWMGVDYFDGYRDALTPDLTPERQLAHDAYIEKRRKDLQAMTEKRFQALYGHHGAEMAIKIGNFVESGFRSRPRANMEALSRLMQTRAPRSNFRISLIKQVLAWMALPEGERKYNFPLSPRQMDAITHNVFTR